MPALLRTTALWVYPVKSCRGLLLSEARLTSRGLEHDREWMITRTDGTFITQREFPLLALIQTALDKDRLTLAAPKQGSLEVPLKSEPGLPREVRVWKDTCAATDQGDQAAGWLSDFLGLNVRLVRFDLSRRRLSNSHWTGEWEAENAFADAFPILVLSEESLSDLNQRVEGAALPMNRFRPNIVVNGGGAYVEDRTERWSSNGVTLRMVKPCVRCRITTTDQETAEVGKEPLRTLAQYRRDEELGGVIFGQNAIPTSGVGTMLRVGEQWIAE